MSELDQILAETGLTNTKDRALVTAIARAVKTNAAEVGALPVKPTSKVPVIILSGLLALSIAGNVITCGSLSKMSAYRSDTETHLRLLTDSAGRVGEVTKRLELATDLAAATSKGLVNSADSVNTSVATIQTNVRAIEDSRKAIDAMAQKGTLTTQPVNAPTHATPTP